MRPPRNCGFFFGSWGVGSMRPPPKLPFSIAISTPRKQLQPPIAAIRSRRTPPRWCDAWPPALACSGHHRSDAESVYRQGRLFFGGLWCVKWGNLALYYFASLIMCHFPASDCPYSFNKNSLIICFSFCLLSNLFLISQSIFPCLSSPLCLPIFILFGVHKIYLGLSCALNICWWTINFRRFRIEFKLNKLNCPRLFRLP